MISHKIEPIAPDAPPAHNESEMSVRTAASLSALLRTAGCAETFVESQLAAIGLSLPKLTALHRLTEADIGLPLGLLADRLSCVKSNVTQLIDRLEADGFVTRTADPNDRRSRLAYITPAGRAAHDEGMRIRTRAEQQLFAGLSDDDTTRLAEILERLDRSRP